MRKLLVLTLIVLLGLPPTTGAEPLEGVEYVRLSNPQPVETEAKIEVREFFWYGCPHCYSLEPFLEKWHKTMPKNAKLIRTPGTASRWLAHAQAYYTFETLGLIEKLHAPFFDAVQRARLTTPPDQVPIADEDSIVSFAIQHGIDGRKFRDVYRSFGVGVKLDRAKKLNKEFPVESVPIIFVDGIYMTNANITGGEDKVFQVVNYLIKKAAAERARKK